MKVLISLALFLICVQQSTVVVKGQPGILTGDTQEQKAYDTPKRYSRPSRPRNQKQPKSTNSTGGYNYVIARFGTIPSIIAISTRTPIGTVIGKLTDRETGNRKSKTPLTFHLEYVDPVNGTGLFTVHNQTGKISTAGNLTIPNSFDGQIIQYRLRVGVTAETPIAHLGEEMDLFIKVMNLNLAGDGKEDPGLIEMIPLWVIILFVALFVATLVCGIFMGYFTSRLRQTRRSYTLYTTPPASRKPQTPPSSRAQPQKGPTTIHKNEGLRTAPYGTEGNTDEDSVQLDTTGAKFSKAKARPRIGQGGGAGSQDPVAVQGAMETPGPSNQGVGPRRMKNQSRPPAPKIPNSGKDE